MGRKHRESAGVLRLFYRLPCFGKSRRHGRVSGKADGMAVCCRPTLQVAEPCGKLQLRVRSPA